MSKKVRPKKRGRPATGRDPVVPVRLSADVIKAIDAEAEAAGVSRSEAIREVIEAGLKRRSKP